MSDGRLLTQSEYAKQRGCSQQYVSRLIASGRIPTVGADKRIDPVAADAALAQTACPGRTQGAASRKAAAQAAGKPEAAAVRGTERSAERADAGREPAPAGGNGSGNGSAQQSAVRTASATYTDARAMRESALAQQALLDYRRSVGELCEVKSVEQAIGDCAVASRQLILQIPNRIAARVAAELGVDVRKLQPLMQAEIERVCIEIADTAKALPERLGATRQ